MPNRNPKTIADELKALHDKAAAESVAPSFHATQALTHEWLQATTERMLDAGMLADQAAPAADPGQNGA